MKTYVITLSRTFLSKHSKAGRFTRFAELFENGQHLKPAGLEVCSHKIHTIRTNFALWKKCIDEVAKGEAILSIRQWSGKPYRSKQVLLANLTAENGVGIQKLTFQPDRDGAFNFKYFDIDGHYADIKDVARHDGLSFEEWREWFKDCDLSQPLAVIHFTKFRY